MKEERPDSPWRIKYIPFESSLKPIKTNYGALFGVFIFVFGMFLPVMVMRYSFLTFLRPYFTNNSHMIIYVSLCGFLIAAASLVLSGRKLRKKWKKIKVKCIDKQIKQEYSLDSDMGKTWQFILLCEFKFQGKIYQVTPSYWHTFFSRAGLIAFLDKNISPEGDCYLYVNPANPLQTELSNNGIKDILLHK